jgi:hypothetical protein
VMLRTTVPGHEKCKEANVKPFKSHVEFKSELVADLQPWHLFSQFNDHRKCKIRVIVANPKSCAPASSSCRLF